MSTWSSRIIADNDDGYYSPNLWFPSDNFFSVGSQNIAGLRFQNVTIPQGAIINSASLQFETPGFGNPGGETTQVYGIAEDNTASMATNPIGRTKTSQFVEWDWSVFTSANTVYTSPDLTAVIQEIINRSGWVSGNALGFLIPANDTSGSSQQFISYHWDTTKAPLLTIDYSVSPHITQSLGYTVKIPQSITQLLRYRVVDLEQNPVPFSGLKVAKSGHNVLNTNDPNNLNFSTDYNTLKYHLSGLKALVVSEGVGEDYTLTTTIDHNLGYYPLVEVYAQDDEMANPQPLGRFQAGSGITRSFFYQITKTQVIFIVKGFSGATGTGDSYTVNFYYKVFRNDLSL